MSNLLKLSLVNHLRGSFLIDPAQLNDKESWLKKTESNVKFSHSLLSGDVLCHQTGGVTG